MIQEVVKASDFVAPQCNSCEHFEGALDGIPTCPAYRGGIPDEILFNDVLHLLVFEEQEGVLTYKKKAK